MRMIELSEDDLVELRLMAENLRKVAAQLERGHLVAFVCLTCDFERKFDIDCFVDRDRASTELIDGLADSITLPTFFARTPRPDRPEMNSSHPPSAMEMKSPPAVCGSKRIGSTSAGGVLDHDTLPACASRFGLVEAVVTPCATRLCASL